MKDNKEIEMGTEFIYKDYKAVVDDNNFDDITETLVEIYRLNEEDMIEVVSLKKQDLEQNIKEYIEDTYYEKQIDVPSEKAYLSFVLGYDFLQEMLKSSKSPECDTSYDFCNYVSSKFLESEDYKNLRYSTYEMLDKWINENKAQIQYDYNEYIGKKYETYKEKTILLQGNRREQPVALVERNIGENVEYVIAFNYEIKDNDLTWGYGYYYDDNFNKAIQDYQKVLLGGDLADTFAEKKDTQKELKIKLVGIDNWDRPVFKDESGNVYKDVNLGRGVLALHTSSSNDFYGEPDMPINDDIKVNIVKSFNKNKNKEQER